MKLCVDCKHDDVTESGLMYVCGGAIPVSPYKEHRCRRWPSKASVVDGLPLWVKSSSCEDERASWFGCGITGRYWEAK